MLRRWFCLVVCLQSLVSCGVVPLPAGLTDPTAPPPLRAQDAEFRTLAARWFGVWSTDAAAIAEAEALFAPEADAVYFDGFLPLEGGFGRDGWSAATRAAARARFSGLEIVPREGLWLRRIGDRAIVSVYFRVVLDADSSQPTSTDGESTLICERRSGVWTIVHEHTSFNLIEEKLGGEPIDAGASRFEHVHAHDSEFAALIDEYLGEFAVSRGSDASRADAPARFFASDPDVLVWDPTSRRPLASWSSVAAHRDAPDLRVYLSNKTRRGDVRVWKRGDLAWAVFTFNARATRRNGDRFELVGRQTDVFQKLGGAWKIVHEHASVPFGPDGTPGVRSELVAALNAPIVTRIERQPAQVAPVADPELSKVSFDERLSEYAAAWSIQRGAFDENRIARLYSPEGLEASRTFVDGAAWTLPFRRQVWAEVMETMTLAPERDVTAVRRRDVAWTTNTQAGTFQQRDGTRGTVRQFQSAVWEYREGRWLIVSEHVTVEHH